ncbi:MAG: preprotein translocase subunit SecY [Candidatus Latescibacteria bacterium]|nr:preprotein translocase subunit SecY [Candidatus Latescibacterota bacterium]
MVGSIQSLYKIPDLRKRITFVLLMCIVYRLGGIIPIPGINAQALVAYMSGLNNSLLGMYDMFVGGSFTKMTIFALGIMPYISASIIIQLLGSVVPYFQRLSKEGEEGRKKITQYTRYGTVFLSAAQAFGIAKWLERLEPVSGVPIVSSPGFGFTLLVMITVVSGTVFLMWLGEQMTEHGIGNGISIIIFIGIIARFPYAMKMQVTELLAGTMNPIAFVIFLAFLVIVVAAVVLLTQGQRRIRVQYPKKVVGRKIYGGQSTYIPLRVNTAGVIPIIFAQAIMFVPQTAATMIPWEFLKQVSAYFQMTHPVYWIFYGSLIIFFTYFYTAIVFNPVDLADNLKKYGAVIPQKPPGKKTAEHIDKILTRITLPGSVFLALIAIMPFFMIRFARVNPEFASFFGGTGLLIVVGVALDTLQQIEAKMVERHYEGLLKGAKVRGRR